MVMTTSPPQVKTAQKLIRVVFADDSAAIRTLARYALSAQRGFSIVGEATDGAQALELMDVHEAECVVLDVEMPGMGGFEALAQLQRLRPTVPVVMLSGHSDAEIKDRSVAGGAAAYLEKGRGLGSLADTVRRVTQAAAAPEPHPVLEQALPPVAPPPVAPPHVAAPPVTAPPVAPAPAAPSDTSAADLRRLEYVVSHDLGEPARIVTGFSKLLSTRYATQLDDSGRLFLQHIESAAARLQTMLDDLLTYSRAGRSEPSPSTVATEEVVEEVFAGLSATAERTGAKLVLGELPTLWADRKMVRTVLHHLVLNGLLFNSSPTPTVTVTGTTEGDRAVITVGDNGIGIAPQHLSDIFELFRRLNTREDYAGTGTGLALCHRLITAQFGTIAVRSTLGDGTTVTVTFPIPTSGENR